MASSTSTGSIEAFLQKADWEKARKIIRRALNEEPENHWLLTQLGVTYYEQGEYREALVWFLASLKVVSDCPLTLWNLAGALDAIGKPELAIRYYTWLLKSNKSAIDDPCWESNEWADALKTDCVYRVGVCFQHMKQHEPAENCFRQYINLLLDGRIGTYTIQDAVRHIREAHTNGKPSVRKSVRQAIDSTLRAAGIQSIQPSRTPPKLSVDELLAT